MEKNLRRFISVILILSLLHIQIPSSALNVENEMNLINAHVTITMDKEFGSMAILGDVNGDGLDDLMVGIGSDSNNFGKAYLFFGNSSGWDRNIDNSNADASFIGENQKDYAGNRVSGVGDVNGDGYCDLLISAGGYDNGQDMEVGKVYLIFGKKMGWGKDISLSTADASFIGVRPGDYVGSAGIEGGGDVNGDGYDDFLISTKEGNGTVYVIFGKPSGWRQNLLLSNADASFTGETGGDQAGSALSCNGDLNGDGYDDIFIGARRNEDGGNIGGTPAGKSYVVFGKSSGWQTGANLATANASWIGALRDEGSGYSVAFVGDVNGDGYEDGLIGAPFYRVRDPDTGPIGKSYLIFGKADGWIKNGDTSDADASFEGSTYYDWSGWSVSNAGDVNGDGYSDFIIGGPQNREIKVTSGKSFLLLGKASGWAKDSSLEDADAMFQGYIQGERTGYYTSGGGDLNGDGYDDILIGGTDGRCFLLFPDSNSPPSDISFMTAYSDPTFSLKTFAAEQTDKVFIELAGTDTNSSRRDLARVNITSSQYPRSIELRLIESGINTGKYRGNFTIANRTHERYRWINGTEGGWVQITSRRDPTKFINLTIGQGIGIDPRLTAVYAPEDAFYTQQFEATNILPDSWSFDTNASWLMWNPSTREIYGTPNNSHVGTYWAEIKAEAINAKGVVNFTIQVNNTEPVITTPNVLVSYEGREYIINYISSDDGQGTITWHMNSDAQWLLLNRTNGFLNGTPQQSDVGNYTVNISVDDGNGGWDYTEFILRVTDVNDPPILEKVTITPDTVFRGESSTIYIEAWDPESGAEIMEPLVEARSPSSNWMKVNCSYNFEGDNFTAVYIPSPNSVIGKHSFRIKLKDNGNVSSQWYYFNDSLVVRNNPPVILENFENISVYNDKNSLFDLIAYATDFEDTSSELSWEVVEYSPTSLFDAYMKNDTVVEIWPASAERSGLGKIHFKVKDSDQGVFHKNITVEMLNSTEKPNVVINLESPENSTIINTETLNLTWSSKGYPGPVTYDIYYGDSIDNMTLVFSDVQNTTVELTGLEDNTTYYWKITAMIDGVPTVFESEIWQFTVMKGFEPDELEIDFDVSEVTVKMGERVTVNLILTNITTGPIAVDLAVEGELKEFVTINDKFGIVVDGQRTISVHIFGDSSLEAGNYILVIRASFSGQESTTELTVKVEETTTSTSKESSSMWLWIMIVVILMIGLVAVFLVIFLRSKKKKEEDGGEMLDAEIEATPQAGITTADLNLLSLGETQGRYVDFQGRLAEMPLQYKLPDQTSPYQHKPLAPAPQVTLPQLKVTGDVKEPPKALPQMSAVPVDTAAPTPTLPVSTPVTPAEPQEPPALPMVGSVPTVPITPSVTVAPATPPVPPPVTPPPAPPAPPKEPPLPPPAPFSPVETGIKLSHDSVKNASVFRIDSPMPCSICYGEISSGLQASRCSCGNISHLSCGIKVGKCAECADDYQGMLNTVSQEAIVKSVEDSKKTAKREVEVQVEWDEKGDMMKGLLKKLLNNEITVEQYEKISNDIRESF